MFKKIIYASLVSLLLSVNAHAFSVVWTTSLNGTTNNYDAYTSVARDSSNNIFAAGISSSGANNLNAILTKYNSAGVLQWTTSYNMTGTRAELYNGVTVDNSGNVIAVGAQLAVNERFDGLLRKYNTSGALVCSSTYDDIVSNHDVFFGVAVDTSNNIWVAGLDRGINGLLLEYNSSCSLLRTITYDSVAHATEKFAGVVVDSNSNVYVAGQESRPDINQGTNALVVKYNSTGTLVWISSYNSNADNYEAFNGVALDSMTNVIAVGVEVRPDLGLYSVQNENFLIQKYTSGGLLLKTTSYHSSSTSTTPTSDINSEIAYGVATDASSNIYVIGTENRVDNNHAMDVRLFKFNPTLSTRTDTAFYSSLANTPESGYGICLDSALNIIIVGFEYRTGRLTDAWIRKYSP